VADPGAGRRPALAVERSQADDVIPLARPVLGEAEERAVIEVLRSGQLSLGPRLEEFERLFAARVGAAHACALSSGTAGLHLALRAVDVGEGDEVVTSPFSFVASANAAVYERARPVFADIDPVTLNLDPDAAAAAVTERTRALLPVHIFGYPADMPAFERLADRHGLAIVEDACEALGAAHADGVPVGGRGHPAVFGFYANKQLTTGEGGMVTLADPALKQRIDSERNQGRSPDMGWLDHDRLGFNYRLSDIACALGIAQLERLDAMLADRARVAGLYREALAGVEGLELPCADLAGNRRGWFVFVVQLPHGVDRDETIRTLAAAELLSRALRAPRGGVPRVRGRRRAIAGAAVFPGDDGAPGHEGGRLPALRTIDRPSVVLFRPSET
jgi:perosamine synthetase